jgi:hypothetical protein
MPKNHNKYSYFFHQAQNGFTLVATIVFAMVAIAFTSTMVILNKNIIPSSKSLPKLYSAQALAELGLARAIDSLEGDKNWTNNAGILYNNVSYNNGNYTTTLSSASTHNISINSQASFQGSYFTIEKEISRSLNQSSEIQDSYFISVSTANAIVSAGGVFSGLTISNSSTTRDVVIEEIMVCWLEDSGEKIQTIKFDALEAWADTPGDLSGTYINLTNTTNSTISAGASDIDFYTDLNSSAVGKSFSVFFFFADNSFVQVDCTPGQGDSQSSLLAIDTSSCQISGGNNNFISSITLTNMSLTNSIQLTGIILYWFYDNPTRTADRIKIGNTLKWTGGATAGNELTFTSPYLISPGDSKDMNLTYDGDMSYRVISFNMILGDDSTKSGEADFTIDQSAYLGFNNSTTTLVSSTSLRQMYLENTHSEANLWPAQMKVTVEPDNSQKVESVYLDSQEIFSGSVAQNTFFNVDITEIPGSGSLIHQIDFDASVSNATYNITYKMVDDSVTTNSFAIGNMNSLFSYTNLDSAIQTYDDPKTFRYLYLHNSSGANYTISYMKPSWSPDNGEKVETIKINNTTIKNYSAGYSSGTNIDVNDYQINSGSADYENIFIFKDEMLSKDLTIEYTFSDGSKETVTALMNPASWIAGDNFESGTLTGGSGFSSTWSYSGDVQANQSANTYSGVYALKLTGNSEASRALDFSGYSGMNIRFFILTEKYDNSDYIYLEVKESGSSTWRPVASWHKNDVNSQTYIEQDLSAYNLGTDFQIKFRADCNKSDEIVYIDELYFFE